MQRWSSPRGLLQFNQNTMSRGRMNEGDQRALGTGSWRLVDQSNPTRLQMCQRSVDVVHPQRDVMDARPPLREESRNRRRRIGGCHV